MTIFEELKRRNVIRIAAAYLVAAWLVVQVVETIFPAFGFGAFAVRIVVIVLAIGFLPAVVLAWAFELTPQGLRRERSVGPAAPASVRTMRRLDRVILLALALALGYLAFDKFALEPARDAALAEAAARKARAEALVGTRADNSIAVLPFVNMSSDPEQDYLSDGIAEEVLNLLARIPELRVIARSSSFAFKGRDVELADLAHKLDVAYVLEGSVRKAGDRVRITAQLIDVPTESHLWSQTYDRSLGDILAIQDDIARAVVPALRVRVLDAVPAATPADPTAYALYLQALYLYEQRTAHGLERAIEHIKEALRIDPQYAPSWTLLGSAYINQTHVGLRPAAESYALASAAVDRALVIDPNCAYAHSARAWIAMVFERDFTLSAKHFQRALELAPNSAVILANSARLTVRLGRLEEALDLTQRSIRVNPISSAAYGHLADQLARSGRLDEAQAAAETSVELNPASGFALGNLAGILLLRGQPERSLSIAESIENEMARLAYASMGHWALGSRQVSDQELTELEDRYAADAAYYIACAHAWRGDLAGAFSWLNRALDEEQPLAGVSTEPFLTALHGDPRWPVLLERAGVSDEQVASVEFTVPPSG
jgi:adenylate cyclase